jgi:molecular chaperone DnaK
MPDNEIILGIDLGTTFSVAAYVDDFGRPAVIPNAEGTNTTPSVVLIEHGQILVGAPAANQALAKHGQVLQWIKRSMGDLDYAYEGLGPIEISAEILKKIKADCEQYFADRRPPVTIRRAVITCPAYFSAVEVENTMKAGALAGFDVQEIVREPTAAAVYYGVEHLCEGDKLLVCDLGGGTFDASILALDQGTFRPLATAGDRQLGGHDWTSDLVVDVAERLMEEFGEDPRIDPVTEQVLYDSCERLKRSFAQSDHGIITCVYKGQTAEVTVSRDQFERLTEWRVRQVMDWAEKALAKADPPLTWGQIDHILLVGGATRMRRVAEALAERSGKRPIQTGEADTMVALGAAIMAKGAYRPRRVPASSGIKPQKIGGLVLLGPDRVIRTAVRNLGTRAIVRLGRDLEIQNSTIIPHGTDLPAEKSRTDYRTTVPGQAFFDIPVVEFDDVGPDVILQTYRFQCPPDLPKGTPVAVTFRYDQSGQIDVDAVERRGNGVLAKERVPYQEPDITAVASPRRIVFALDVSGSMIEYHKIDRARQALLDEARVFIDAGAGQTEIGVVAFGSQAQVVCPPTADFRRLEAAVARLDVYGTTAMHAGLSLALDLLAGTAPGVLRQILLISDGMPDNMAETLAVGASIRNQGVQLYSVSLGAAGINEAFLSDLSPNFSRAENAEGLGQMIASLLMQDTSGGSAQAGITWLKGANGA